MTVPKTPRLVPASPQNLLPWIIEALANGPMTRDEVRAAVDEIARARRFYVTDMLSLKKALAVLHKNGHVRNLRKGWWCLNDADFPSEIGGPKSIIVNGNNIPIAREVGSGDQVTFFARISAEGLKRPPSEIALLFIRTAGPDFLSETLIDVPESGMLTIPLAIYSQDAKSLAQMVSISAGADASVSTIKASPYAIEVFYRSWLKASVALRKTRDESELVLNS